MKKLFVIFSLVLFSIVAMAQKGQTISCTVDTVQGNETIYITTGKVSGTYASFAIQALCTQTGGTSDGSIVLQGSVDGTSYQTLKEATDYLYCANDTFTIVNAGVAMFVVHNPAHLYYRLKIAGTSGDSTKVTAKYMLK